MWLDLFCRGFYNCIEYVETRVMCVLNDPLNLIFLLLNLFKILN